MNVMRKEAIKCEHRKRKTVMLDSHVKAAELASKAPFDHVLQRQLVTASPIPPISMKEDEAKGADIDVSVEEVSATFTPTPPPAAPPAIVPTPTPVADAALAVPAVVRAEVAAVKAVTPPQVVAAPPIGAMSYTPGAATTPPAQAANSTVQPAAATSSERPLSPVTPRQRRGSQGSNPLSASRYSQSLGASGTVGSGVHGRRDSAHSLLSHSGSYGYTPPGSRRSQRSRGSRRSRRSRSVSPLSGSGSITSGSFYSRSARSYADSQASSTRRGDDHGSVVEEAIEVVHG